MQVNNKFQKIKSWGQTEEPLPFSIGWLIDCWFLITCQSSVARAASAESRKS